MMTGDYLSRRRDLADETNDLVPLLLGLVDLLNRFAASVEEVSMTSPANGKADISDDALLAAALGILSLRRTVRRWADHAASDAGPPQPRTTETVAPPLMILR
jgi:hypothetical protein